MADLGWPEIVTIAIIAFVLFGWRRLPDVSRSLGRSIRVFRSELGAVTNDTTEDAASSPGSTSPGHDAMPTGSAGKQ